MRRPRLRALSEWLRRLAHRVYPEPLHTLEVSYGNPAGGIETHIFIDCREVRRQELHQQVRQAVRP